MGFVSTVVTVTLISEVKTFPNQGNEEIAVLQTGCAQVQLSVFSLHLIPWYKHFVWYILFKTMQLLTFMIKANKS